MKRASALSFALLAVAVAGVLAWLFLAWAYPGAIRSEQRPLPPFSRIVVHGVADVTLVQAAAESATVSGAPRTLSRLRTDVSDGTLTIASGDTRQWWTAFFGAARRPVRVTVTFRNLDAIDASGAVKVSADSLKTDRLALSGSGATAIRIAGLDAKRLSVGGDGAMKIELAGRVLEQTLDLSGAADYRAANLASETAEMTVSGAGSVVVRVQKTLRINASGAASVEYIGNPTVTQQVSGAGRVRQREAASER